MPKVVSKKNLSKLSNKSKTQKGGNKSSKSKKSKTTSQDKNIFTNIKYKYNNFTIPELKCSRCHQNKYKVRTLTMGSKTKSYFNAEILDNRFKVFTCVNCGSVDIFSNNISCNGKTCDTSWF